MHIHGCPSRGRSFQDILFYMQGEGRWFLCSAFLDLHSPPRTSSLTEEEIHQIREALEDQNTDHGYPLNRIEN